MEPICVAGLWPHSVCTVSVYMRLPQRRTVGGILGEYGLVCVINNVANLWGTAE